jgi:hypothetical protein
VRRRRTGAETAQRGKPAGETEGQKCPAIQSLLHHVVAPEIEAKIYHFRRRNTREKPVAGQISIYLKH